MEKEWLSIAEIADRLGLAENTARRYSNLFKDFLKNRKFGRTTKYTVETVEVISRIAGLYGQGLSTDEIRQRLKDEIPQVVDVVAEKEEQLAVLSSYELIKQMAEEQAKQREEQEIFSQALIKRLDQQAKYIEQSLKKRDEQLMQYFETKKQIAAAKEKKWWRFWN